MLAASLISWVIYALCLQRAPLQPGNTKEDQNLSSLNKAQSIGYTLLDGELETFGPPFTASFKIGPKEERSWLRNMRYFLNVQSQD